MLRRAPSRLSRIWVPTGGIASSGDEDGHSKLIRAGFLRQSYPGVFNMLPLGRRVQEKTENLVERHMEESLAASRLSLSTISSEALWSKSGRLQNVASELFRFPDRRGVPYLLSPTHEEEITSLVARTVKSHKELPLRLYQITRKYRDEFRPRHGLLRGREFTMKDLYTFDINLEAALETYHQVGLAYSNIFREMRLPVLAAKASSGDMGGDLSHEYILPTPLGEDRVANCSSCDYVVNEEVADTVAVKEAPSDVPVGVWRGITKDRTTLVNVWYPTQTESPASGGVREYNDADINIFALKSILPDLDAGVEDVLPLWKASVGQSTQSASTLLNIVDGRLPASFVDNLKSGAMRVAVWPGVDQPPSSALANIVHSRVGADGRPLNLLRIRTGDECPHCTTGTLRVQKGLELGHTFHLGTRYSEPLEATISAPSGTNLTGSGEPAQPGNDLNRTAQQGIPIQMGCHGIGISRIIGAVAEHFADERGLNWPVAIAPYSCVIIPGRDVADEDALEVYGSILGSLRPSGAHLDPVIDDRAKGIPWKLNDADLVGYPVIIVLGKGWYSSRYAEVQCRRLKVKEFVHIDDLPRIIADLYIKL
ncbi:hypothetical protein V8F06_009916 [Rhypophila decipiens]